MRLSRIDPGNLYLKRPEPACGRGFAFPEV